MASTHEEGGPSGASGASGASSSLQRGDLNCTAAMQKLWDFLDQELNDEQMLAVRRHVESCSDCFPHKAWAERFLEALHSLRGEQLMPPELKARVLERLKTAGYGR